MQYELVRAASDSTAQLMQLGKAEALGVFDQHHSGVRHVHSHFNDRGTDQHAR
jgi:hypothetical protein